MKKYGLIITLLLFSVAVFSQGNGVRAVIKNKKVLKNIISISGMEHCGKELYVVNDNTPWLYNLNNKLKIKNKFLIYPAGQKFKKLPESLKPDFQSIACDKDKLMIFGSGKISPQSDIIVKYNLKTATAEIFNVKEFYNVLCAAAKINRGSLNIKAAVISGGILYLFDGGNNKLLVYKLRELDKYLKDFNDCPVPEVYNIQLPMIDGNKLEISGATDAFNGNKIIFTANTLDGKHHCYLGYINILNLKDNLKPVCVELQETGGVSSIRAESVLVKKDLSGNWAELIVVADRNGKAELLYVDMQILIR